MGRALMIGGVFLLSRNPEALADWYRRHLEWEPAFLPDEGYYTELYFREDDEPDHRQRLVFAIMPGDPGYGEGHIINCRVDDIESVVAALREEGVETSEITQGPDADAKEDMRDFGTPRVIESNSGSTSTQPSNHS
jgi:catechol 2,3-dioxygenase-like lactoylglutathione lyase family enzyme